MLKTLFSAALVAAVLFNCGILKAADKVLAESSHPAHFSDKNEHHEAYDIIKLTEGLDISAEQKQRLSAEKKHHNERIKALQDSLHSKRAELTAELDKPVSDKAKLDADSAEMKSLMSQMMDERLSSVLRIKEILTPEQYKKFVEKKNSLLNKHSK